MMGCVIKSPIAQKKKKYLRSNGYSNKLVVLKDSFLLGFHALEVSPEI